MFERVHEELAGDAWLIGRITGPEFAKGKPYPAARKETFPGSLGSRGALRKLMSVGVGLAPGWFEFWRLLCIRGRNGAFLSSALRRRRFFEDGCGKRPVVTSRGT